MDKLFDTVLELSWQAGLIALAVMAVRLVLRKKASRRALCMLWALVALRLLLPVSLTVESPVSLQAEEAPVSRAYHAMQEARTSVPEEAAPAPAGASGAGRYGDCRGRGVSCLPDGGYHAGPAFGGF